MWKSEMLVRGYLYGPCISIGVYIFRPLQRLASVRKFKILHCCSVVYLHLGGGNFCRQNDVAVTLCIRAFDAARSDRAGSSDMSRVQYTKPGE